MWVYFLTFACSLLLFFWVSPSLKNKRFPLYDRRTTNGFQISKVACACFLAALPPMFVSAVRYNVGTDYVVTYYTGFYRILEGNKFDKFEYGYYLLCKLIQLFTKNVFWVFAITAIIFVGFTYKAIYELSDNIVISIIMLLLTRNFFISMNVVRQFIAISILTYAIKYIIKKDLKKYIIFILLAMSFHASSIIFLPIYFIGKIKIPPRKLFGLAILDLVIFGVAAGELIRLLQSTKYEKLLIKYEVCGLNFTIFHIVLNVLILIVAYRNYESRKDDVKYHIFLNIQIFSFLIAIVLRSIPLMERIYWIFSFPLIVTFPTLLGEGNKQMKRMILILIFLILAVYMLHDIGILNDHHAIPYQWIFGKTPIHCSGFRKFR